MCIDCVGPVRVAEFDLMAYKIVHGRDGDAVFLSRYRPYQRTWQKGYQSRGYSASGIDILYRIGETVVSTFETTPGLYCFEDHNDAIKDCWAGEVILKVKIPEGTLYRRVQVGELPPVLLAETLVVLEHAHTELKRGY